MSFVKYAAYKDSGVEWLGEVPEHWGILKLKRVAALQSGDFITSESILPEGEYPVFGGNGLRGFTDRYTHEGDYALVGRQGALCGNVNYASGKIYASEHEDVVFPRTKMSVRWIGELLYAMNLNQYSVSAAQPGLAVERISDLYIPFPCVSEQTQIARFLDHETARIDALIEEQQRLIALLKEKRQAVISHAVTKGLDPNVPMKDSGVEWLGEVPAHWQETSLKWLFRQEKRQGYTDLDVLSVYRDYGVILKSSRADNGNKTPEDLSLYQLVEVGDLVVNKMKAWQGSLGVSEYRGITSPDYVVYSPSHSEVSRFIHFSLRASHMPEVYLSVSNGIRPNQWRIEPEQFEQLSIFLPGRSEQLEIVSYLDERTREIDELIQSCEAAHSIFLERRSALISAAVTGKIDLRDWQPPVASSTFTPAQASA